MEDFLGYARLRISELLGTDLNATASEWQGVSGFGLASVEGSIVGQLVWLIGPEEEVSYAVETVLFSLRELDLVGPDPPLRFIAFGGSQDEAQHWVDLLWPAAESIAFYFVHPGEVQPMLAWPGGPERCSMCGRDNGHRCPECPRCS
jgi:hypothetical protein